MVRALRWLGKGLFVLVCMAYPWLARRALLGQSGETLHTAAFLLALAPLFLMMGWLLYRARNKVILLGAFLGMGLIVYFLYGHGQINARAAFGIPHFVINFSLLVFFGRTLLHGEEPLITRVARYVHGTLKPREMAYTRQVTIAWCVYFAGQLVTSILLFELAPIAVWSLFVNFLTFPLLAVMFVGEYAIRHLTQPQHPHVSILESIRAFNKNFAASRSETP